MIIATKDKYIHYLSGCYIGKTHDYALLKSEFPPQKNWFSQHKVRVDLGYQGFEKDFECKKVIIPHKKPPKQELTELQIEENKQKSKKRIWVEHSIGGMKNIDSLPIDYERMITICTMMHLKFVLVYGILT